MLKSLALPRYFKKNNYNILTPQLAPDSERSTSSTASKRSTSSARASSRWIRTRLQCSPLTRWHRRRKGFAMLPNITATFLLFLGLLICGLSTPFCQGTAVPVPAAKSKGTISTYGTRTGLTRIGVADTAKIANLTRQHGGDLFYTFENDKCDTDTCVGLSSGTASLSKVPLNNVQNSVKEIDMLSDLETECKCQCLSHLATYREDLGICVDDVRAAAGALEQDENEVTLSGNISVARYEEVGNQSVASHSFDVSFSDVRTSTPMKQFFGNPRCSLPMDLSKSMLEESPMNLSLKDCDSDVGFDAPLDLVVSKPIENKASVPSTSCCAMNLKIQSPKFCASENEHRVKVPDIEQRMPVSNLPSLPESNNGGCDTNPGLYVPIDPAEDQISSNESKKLKRDVPNTMSQEFDGSKFAHNVENIVIAGSSDPSNLTPTEIIDNNQIDCPSSSTRTVINGVESSCGSDVEPYRNASIVGFGDDVIDRVKNDSTGEPFDKPGVSCKRISDEDQMNAEDIVVNNIVVTRCNITRKAPIIVTGDPSTIYLAPKEIIDENQMARPSSATETANDGVENEIDSGSDDNDEDVEMGDVTLLNEFSIHEYFEPYRNESIVGFGDDEIDREQHDPKKCTLAPFVSGSTSEKIPFVFLPHRGQIVYPSKEIGFPGVKMPMCAVSGSQYLTHAGWAELRNPIDTDVPFRLFRDEGRIYLQWLGEPDLRQRMQGRLVLVHLMCRDMTPRLVLKDGRTRTVDDIAPNQNIFTPCIAFRVVGTPIKYINNVTEVSFSSETHIDSESGLSTKEYIVIAICSLCLGLIYIASVFLYIHMKKRKRSSGDDDDANTIKNEYSSYQQNDQVTFGVGLSSQVNPFTNQPHNSFIGRGGSQRQSGNTGHRSLTTALNVGLHAEEMGIVKNNPLLKHFPNLSDNSGFISDNSNSVSEFEDERTIDAEKMQTKANIHQSKNYLGHTDMDGGLLHPQQSHHSHHQQMSQQNPDGYSNPNGPDTECLPEENVSIVEDISNDEKLESMKSIVNGTMRRKLYFNPAYFEPHLLVSPPPAAIEFLNKIREVITIAKYKMSAKRFQPSLNIIPEELLQNQGSETYAVTQTAPPSRRSSLISSRRDSSKKSICSGCPGCEKKGNSDVVVPSSNCKNCGDKQNSIRKWLEDVSTNHGEVISDVDMYDGSKPSNNSSENPESLRSLDDRSTCESLPINPEIKKQPKSLRSRQNSVHSDSSSASDNETIVANSVKERSSVTRVPSRSKSIRSDTSSAPKIVSHSLKSDVVKMAKFGPDDGSIMKNNNFIYDHNPIEGHSKANQDIYMRNTNNSLVNLDSNKIYDKRDLYNLTGSELFNNPQFESSPKMQHRLVNPSQQHHHHHQQGRRRTNSHSRPNPLGKRQIEVLDQFATGGKVRNLNHMPDMVYEALAMDQRKNSWRGRGEPIPINEYMHDSDSRFSSIDRTEKYRNEKFFHDFINSDDNNTLGNRSGKNSFNKYQPDSPIYSRKSPHYLIVDYETDSLERVTSKTQISFNTSTTNSSDMSSQPSPSHSTALPLEEEVEIRNAIYDRVEGFRKDTDTIPKERECVSIEVDEYEDVPMNSLAETVIQVPTKKGPKIKCDTPFQGSITIEVEHSPDDCELSTDSDQFEPDTLDRKPKKHSNIVGRHRSNVWAQDRLSTKETNLASLPADLNNHLILKNSQSFRETTFGSLREIYESKNLKNVNHNQMRSLEEFEITSGRLLTLELRHSKRQRSTDQTVVAPKLMPPDLIPPEVSIPRNHYDQPRQQLKKVEDYGISPKNLACWNNDKFTKQPNGPAPKPSFYNLENYESTNSLTADSDSTQFTGVSENDHHASKRPKKVANYSQVKKPSRSQSLEKDGFRLDREQEATIAKNYMTLGELNEKNFLEQVDSNIYDVSGKSQVMNRAKFIEDIDKIEVLSTKTLSNYDFPVRKGSPSINSKEIDNDKVPFDGNPITTTKVFRVEINQVTNGMQIAMGLRDRVKKSKDIKNAWKKFIGIATSKFNGKSADGKSDSDLEKNSDSSDILDKDEGISSLIDDASAAYDSAEKAYHHNHRHHHHHKPSSSSGIAPSNRQITVIRSHSRSSVKDDSGYISADSSESRLNRKLYERFNFTAKSIDSSDSIQEENKYEICAIPEHSVSTVKSNTSSSSNGSGRSDKQLTRPKAPPPPLPPPNPPPPPPTTTIPSKKQPSPSRVIEKPQTKPPPPPSHPAPKIPQPEENFLFNTADAISVRVYSSDDENFASSDNASCISENNDDDDDGTSCGTDDICESGAESVETHSVFFKNIRPRRNEACNVAALAH